MVVKLFVRVFRLSPLSRDPKRGTDVERKTPHMVPGPRPDARQPREWLSFLVKVG